MSKEIDRDRARGALAVIKQHPGMVLFVASPAIVVLGLIWAFVSPALAVLLFLALTVGAGVAVLRKR
jgi:hypothetical protein